MRDCWKVSRVICSWGMLEERERRQAVGRCLVGKELEVGRRGSLSKVAALASEPTSAAAWVSLERMP